MGTYASMLSLFDVQNHRINKMEKISKIAKSNHQPIPKFLYLSHLLSEIPGNYLTKINK